jgi:hypothetical protein
MLTVTRNSVLQREHIVTFPRQQWLHDPATILHYTYVASLVLYVTIYGANSYTITHADPNTFRDKSRTPSTSKIDRSSQTS